MEKKANGKKRLVLKFADGIGNYVGEPGWTFPYALRKASHDLGIDARLWEAGEQTETKKTITIQVIRKRGVRPAEPEAPQAGGTDTAEASTGSAGESTGNESDLTSEDLATGAVIKGGPGPESPEPPIVVTLKRSEITEMLKVCVETTGTISPALAHVLIDAAGGLCTISASNLETSYTKTLACETEAAVTTLVPAKTLLAEIKALPPEITDVELSVTNGKGNRAVSVNGRCSIHGQDPEEFPELPSGFTTVVKVRNLKEAVGRVIVAVSRDETRYVLTGLLLDLTGGFAVGCDGFRLHFEQIEAAEPPKDALVIPANAMKIILKFKGEDEVCFSDDARHVAFFVAGGILTARLMDGNYPAYKEVIPKPASRITFAASEFLKLIEGATPLSDKAIRLTINGDLVVTSAHEAGSYEWKIPCTREGGEAKLVYHFNPAFLVDAIKAYPADRVTLGTPDGEYGSCIVNEKAVIMPVRV
jgi:DNA polymerase-3 subunit beta